MHERCQRLGVPLVDWREDVDIVTALEEVRAYRRYARTPRS
jgi:hypothetical protein